MTTCPPLTAVARATLLATAASLAACAAFPDRDPAPTMKPASAFTSSQAFAAPAISWPSDAWWADYRDPQLDTLITEALAGAPSMAQAQARLRKAEAAAGIAEAATGPQVSANASITEQKLSYNHLTPRAATPQGW